MAIWQRNKGVGIHRVNIPGKGWFTVRPGQPLTDSKGDLIDCPPEVFGSHLGGYTQIGGGVEMPKKLDEGLSPQAAYVLEHSGGGYFNVINPDNPGKPINEKGLRKKVAKELLAKLLEVGEDEIKKTWLDDKLVYSADVDITCPFADSDGVFGETFDTFEECTECPHAVLCEKTTGATEQ